MFTIWSLWGVLLVGPVMILAALMGVEYLLLDLIVVMILVASSYVWLMCE